MQRKLAAVLSADIVGYGQLMQRDEAGAMARVRAAMGDVLTPRVGAHGGRVVKLMGDGALAEFASIVSAVRCAIEIQSTMAALDADLPAELRLRYRIGVNLGDVIVENDDIFGDGVNVAARLQALAPAGGVAFSRVVRDQIEGKLVISIEDLGEHAMKNGERPVHVFAAQTSAPVNAATAADDRVSICVLPFSNMSGDPEQEYFSDGVTEDIITDLSRISALAVVSRSTAFTFKGKAIEVGKAARQLGVRYVLEGSVRRAGNRVRISAQLIDGKTDNHIWAERYDRDLNDIFALQTEISEAIVSALKLKLLPAEREALAHRATANPHAYKLYLMARAYSYSPSQRNIEVIIRICKRALELDPNYAAAWALLAIAQFYQRTKDSPQEAQASVDRALALNPNLAEAHGVKGGLLALKGENDAALAAHAHSFTLDQSSFHAYRAAGRTCLHLRRYAEAREMYLKSAALSEIDYGALALAMQCAEMMGDMDGARALATRAMERIERWIATHGDDTTAIALGAGALAMLGERERVLDWAERAMLLDPHNNNGLYNLGCAMVRLGEHERAIDLIEKAVQDAPARVHWAQQDSDLDAIRAHPRFVRVMETARARISEAPAAPKRPRAKKS